MSERITIPIPQSEFPTKIEVYHDGKLNRHGGVQSGATEATIKIPAPLDECEIKIIPCDALGNPAGRGYTYQDENLVPEPPVNTDPPAEPSEEDECCGGMVDCAEVTELVPDAHASVVVERPEVDESVETSYSSGVENDFYTGEDEDVDEDVDEVEVKDAE